MKERLTFQPLVNIRQKDDLMKRRAGFTLIELVIAVLIFSVIAACLYSAFAGGIRLWRRQEEGFRYSHSLTLALERMAKELRNSINYSMPQTPMSEEQEKALIFIGEKNKVSFITVICADIARVTYLFENIGEGGGSLKRTQVLQKEGFKEESQKEDVLAGGLSDLSFEYAYEGAEKNSLPVWKDAWETTGASGAEKKSNVPKGVRVVMALKKAGADKERGNQEGKEILRKTVFIPTGILGKE